MKAFKVLGIIFVSFLALVYAAFLFVLPNAVDLNKYKADILLQAQKEADIKADIEDLKLKTTWDLKIKLVLKKPCLAYLDGEKFLSAEQGSIGVNLVPLVFKKLQLDEISFVKPKLDLVLLPNGKYDIETKLVDNLLKKAKPETQAQPQLPVTLSEKMPDIVLKDYAAALKEKATGNILSVEGKEFRVKDFVPDKKLTVVSSGQALVNGKKHISYNFDVQSFIPKAQEQAQPMPEFRFNPFDAFVKYNFKSDLNADLKITQKDDEIHIKGFFNADKINYKLAGKDVSGSFIKLDFAGNKVDINSNLFVDKSEKVILSGLFKNGKRQNIELKVVSKKVHLADIKSVFALLADIANIKTDLNQLVVNGFLDADFTVKSDMKKIKSDGYLKISDASISHKSLPLRITSIKSDLDFHNNSVKIKNSSALINGSLININGTIDDGANADVKIFADKLPLNLLFEAFAPVNVKASTSVYGGNMDLNALLKGRLDKLSPKVDLDLYGLGVLDKASKSTLQAGKIALNVSVDTKGLYKGTAQASGLSAVTGEPKAIIKLPSAAAEFDTKNIRIKPAQLIFDNSKLTLSGGVEDYAGKKMRANFIVKGNVTANDLLKYLPKENRSLFQAKGSIPVIAQVTSDGKQTGIKAQAMASPSGYFSLLDISNIMNKSSILNLSADIDETSLKLNEAALYGLSHGIIFSQDFKANLQDSYKIFDISGKVLGINSSTPALKGVKIVTPNTVTASISGMKDSLITLTTNLSLDGSALKPVLGGVLDIRTLKVPEYAILIKNLLVDFKYGSIYAKSSMVDINASQFGFDAVIDSNIGKYTVIKDLKVNATYLDLDRLFQTMAMMPQAEMGPGFEFPVIVQKGRGNIEKLKMGEIISTDITGDFNIKNNLLSLSNIKAKAYGGNVIGKITYNIPYTTVTVDMSGRGLDANSSVSAFMGVKNQIFGTLDFDTKVSLYGAALEQQLKSAKGFANFSVSNGRMGSLGTFEHFLYAQNLIAQRFNFTLNSVMQTLAPQNTGRFVYLKGRVLIAGGWLTFSPLHSSGPQMSLYITGKYNMLSNWADMEILGRIAPEVLNALGPLGNMSVSGLLANVPKLGSAISNLLTTYNQTKDAAELAKIPPLTPATVGTKEFMVVINGNSQNTSAVKMFKWLITPERAAEAQKQISIQIPKQVTQVFKIPVSSMNVPVLGPKYPAATSQSVGETVKNTAQQKINETIQENIQKNIQLPNFWDSIK